MVTCKNPLSGFFRRLGLFSAQFLVSLPAWAVTASEGRKTVGGLLGTVFILLDVAVAVFLIAWAVKRFAARGDKDPKGSRGKERTKIGRQP